MKPHDIERVFGHARLRMATGEHVEVFREAASPGERRRYTKRFLATGDADFRQWTDREWRILARLIGHGARCVPDVVQFENRHGGVRQVQTYDAGITIDQWATLLPVTRGGVVRRHVFEDCAHWWALARHCLAALDEIHALGLVHLDIKADNICVPYGPDDFDPMAVDARLHAAFERLALIDFAFSVATGEPLATALPIGWQKDYDYQSPRLLRALETGLAGDLTPTQALDWRCDLYSLAAMLRRYLPDEAWARGEGTACGWTTRRYDDARALVYRLREAHDRDLPLPGRRPHRALLELTGEHLAAADVQVSLQAGWMVARDVEVSDPMRLATPLTRIAPARAVAEARGQHAAPASLIEAWSDSAVAATAVTAVPAVFRTTRIRVIATPAAVDPRRARSAAPRPAARAKRAALILCGIGAVAAFAAAFVPGERPAWVDDLVNAFPALRAPATPVLAANDAVSKANQTPTASGALETTPRVPVPDVAAASAPDAGRSEDASAARRGAGTAAEGAAPDEAARQPDAVRSPQPPIVARAVDEPGRVAHAVDESGRGEPSAGEAAKVAPSVAEAPPPTVSSASERDARATPGTPDPPGAQVGAVAELPLAQKSPAPPRRAPPAAKTAAAAPTTRHVRSAKAAPAPVAPAQGSGGVTAVAKGRSTRPVVLASTPVHGGSAGASVARAPVGPRGTPPAMPASAPATPAAVTSTAASGSATPAASAVTAPPVTEAAAAATADMPAAAAPRTVAAPSDNAAAAPAPPPVETPAPAQRVRPAEPARSVARQTPRDAWQRAMRDIMAALGVREQRAAPVEERSVARPPESRIAHPPDVAVSTPAYPPVYAEARPVERPRMVPAPMPRAEAPVDAGPTVRAIPVPANVAPASAVMSDRGDTGDTGDDLRTQGLYMLREVLPRTAAEARADMTGLLGIAATAETTGQNRAVYDAAVARMQTEGAYLPASAGAGRARYLHAEARRAFAAGRDANATDLAMRAFAANPRDADIAGFLAFLELRRNPETARQLALHALAFSGPDRVQRDEDWNTLAVASALTGRGADAMRAYMVELALTRNVDRTCRAALNAYDTYGERLRAPVQALLYRVRVQGRDYTATSCAWPAYRTAAR